MTPYSFALTVTWLFLNLGLTSSHLLLHRHVGESVTLPCKCQNDNIVMCYWYKQTPGQKPVQVSSYYKHDSKGDLIEAFNSSTRFSLDNYNNDNNLKIDDLHILDSATYFCVGSNLYNFDFLDGITVNVKGAGTHLTTLVHESSSENSEPITLDCTFDTGTCDGLHSVSSFKKTEESEAGVIYTHGGSNDQCERNEDSQTNSCVYNLPIYNVNVDEDWTLCAVASCGQLLFGNRSRMDSQETWNSSILVYVLCGSLALTTTFIISLLCSLYKIIKKNRQTPSTVTTEDAENLHYAAIQHHNKSNRSRKQNDGTNTECVYSSVRL